jgi:transcription initiation factor TFIIIB Brf1 subunit/transcription initiation factor TFIIB
MKRLAACGPTIEAQLQQGTGMWCNVCQSDVAIEVGVDHRRVTCSTCGTVLGETAVSRENEQPASSTQGHRVTEARDLLDRWASNHLFDPYGPPKRPVSVDDVIEEATPRRPAANSGQTAASGGQAARPAPPDRLEDLLEPPPAAAVRPRWDAPHTNVRRPMNLDRRDDGLRGSRPADQSDGGVAETSRRSQPPPSQPPRQPPSPPRSEPASSQSAPTVPPAAGSSEGAGLAASAAELDRLTNEILSRVSRITNQRTDEATGRRDERAESDSRVERRATAERDARDERDVRDEWRADEDSQAISADDYDRAVEAASKVGTASDDRLAEGSGDAWNLAPASQPTPPANDEEPGVAETDEPGLNNGAGASSGAQRRVPRPHAAAFTQRVDAPHQTSQPHADFSYSREQVTAAIEDDSEEDAANWFSGIGQGLAWLGILGLTAGTSLVIVGYFGGPAGYAPMGWLISTIGQMLLFLGIVTLVSSGMEQTTQEVRRTVNEVARKLDLIEDRIIRIDAAESPGPPRPHIADRMVKATRQQRVREEATATRDSSPREAR